MLVFYVLFFFREAELGHLNLYLHYDLPGGSYGLTTLLCFLFGYSFFIGDGLFFVGVTYALIHGISVLIRQKSSVMNLRRVYAVAGLVLVVSSVLVMEAGYYDRDNDEVLDSIEPRLYGAYLRIPIEVEEPVFILNEEKLDD